VACSLGSVHNVTKKTKKIHWMGHRLRSFCCHCCDCSLFNPETIWLYQGNRNDKSGKACTSKVFRTPFQIRTHKLLCDSKSFRARRHTEDRKSFNETVRKRLTRYTYTECPRRNVPDFGRVFLMLNYTVITQNTYVQIWTVTEIMAREVWNFDSCYTLIDY